MYREYTPTNITSASTTQIFTGKGVLQAITVNQVAAGSIKVIDNTSGSTATIATIDTSTSTGTYGYNCTISKGLRIITDASSDITVTWAQG